MAAYRATKYASTGESPNAMMLGRETATPLSLVYPQDGIHRPDDEWGYVAELQYLMAQTHDLTRRQLGKAVKRQTRNYDKQAELEVIPVGSGGAGDHT